MLYEEENLVRNNAKLVVRDYNKQEGKNFTEIFARIECLEEIRILLDFSSYKNIKFF